MEGGGNLKIVCVHFAAVILCFFVLPSTANKYPNLDEVEIASYNRKSVSIGCYPDPEDGSFEPAYLCRSVCRSLAKAKGNMKHATCCFHHPDYKEIIYPKVCHCCFGTPVCPRTSCGRGCHMVEISTGLNCDSATMDTPSKETTTESTTNSEQRNQTERRHESFASKLLKLKGIFSKENENTIP